MRSLPIITLVLLLLSPSISAYEQIGVYPSCWVGENRFPSVQPNLVGIFENIEVETQPFTWAVSTKPPSCDPDYPVFSEPDNTLILALSRRSTQSSTSVIYFPSEQKQLAETASSFFSSFNPVLIEVNCAIFDSPPDVDDFICANTGDRIYLDLKFTDSQITSRKSVENAFVQFITSLPNTQTDKEIDKDTGNPPDEDPDPVIPEKIEEIAFFPSCETGTFHFISIQRSIIKIGKALEPNFNIKWLINLNSPTCEITNDNSFPFAFALSRSSSTNKRSTIYYPPGNAELAHEASTYFSIPDLRIKEVSQADSVEVFDFLTNRENSLYFQLWFSPNDIYDRNQITAALSTFLSTPLRKSPITTPPKDDEEVKTCRLIEKKPTEKKLGCVDGTQLIEVTSYTLDTRSCDYDTNTYTLNRDDPECILSCDLIPPEDEIRLGNCIPGKSQREKSVTTYSVDRENCNVISETDTLIVDDPTCQTSSGGKYDSIELWATGKEPPDQFSIADSKKFFEISERVSTASGKITALIVLLLQHSPANDNNRDFLTENRNLFLDLISESGTEVPLTINARISSISAGATSSIITIKTTIDLMGLGYENREIQLVPLLDPGRYQYRISVFDPQTNKIESIYTKYFQVVDYNLIDFDLFPSYCKTIQSGTNEKYSITFYATKSTASQLQADAKKMLYERFGLFSVEPFKSHRNQFTISIHQQPSLPNSLSTIVYEKLLLTCPKGSFDVWVTNEGAGAFSSFEKHLARLSRPSGQDLTHESGHAFGQLFDEYSPLAGYSTSRARITSSPNCATSISEANQKWSSLRGQGSGVFRVNPGIPGCSYEKKYFRGTENSIMNGVWDIPASEYSRGFGPINEEYLCKNAFKSTSGICAEYR